MKRASVTHRFMVMNTTRKYPFTAALAQVVCIPTCKIRFKKCDVVSRQSFKCASCSNTWNHEILTVDITLQSWNNARLAP